MFTCKDRVFLLLKQSFYPKKDKKDISLRGFKSISYQQKQKERNDDTGLD